MNIRVSKEIIGALRVADFVTGVVAYPDQVECVFFPRIPAHVRSELYRLNGGAKRVFPRVPHPGRTLRPRERKGQVWVILQPTPEALRYLADRRHKRPVDFFSRTARPTFTVYRVDIAIDFITKTPSAATAVGQFLKAGVLHKWHRDKRTDQSGGTYYSSRAGKPRNLVIYSDRPSKTGLGACAHLEFRYRTMRRCKASKLVDLRQLAKGLDTFALLRREARVVYVDQVAFDHFLEKTARAVKRHNREYHDTDLVEVVTLLGRLFAPMIQNAEHLPEPGSIRNARAQDIYDASKKFRRRMIAIKWEEFTEPPRWVPNRCSDSYA